MIKAYSWARTLLVALALHLLHLETRNVYHFVMGTHSYNKALPNSSSQALNILELCHWCLGLFGYAHSVAFPALSAKAGTVKQVDIGLEDFAIAVVDERDEVNGHDHNLKRLATSH